MSTDSQGDTQVTCVDCGAQFTFTARDQAFYQERGYQAPRRCKPCRDKRKAGQGGGGGGGGPGAYGAPSGQQSSWRQPAGGNQGGGGGGGGGAVGAPAQAQFKVTCSGCGAETTVPFKPDPTRPVYCRTCYLNRRKTGQG